MVGKRNVNGINVYLRWGSERDTLDQPDQRLWFWIRPTSNPRLNQSKENLALVSPESVQVSEWGVCVGCLWHDTPVRQHQKKTASSGYRRDITYCVLKRRKTPLTHITWSIKHLISRKVMYIFEETNLTLKISINISRPSIVKPKGFLALKLCKKCLALKYCENLSSWKTFTSPPLKIQWVSEWVVFYVTLTLGRSYHDGTHW